MAGFPLSGVGTGFDNVGRIIDVTDYIYQIKPEDKPFFHMIGEDVAKDPVHRWQKRTFSTYNHNAKGRGFTFTFPDQNIYPTFEHNLTQILAKEVRVSDTEKNTSHFAIDRLFSDQMQLALSILGTDHEVALLLGSQLSGDATGGAPQMRGLHWSMVAGITTWTNVAGAAPGLSEDIYNGFMQLLWEFGSEPRDVLVGGRLKRVISGFTASNTRYIPADQNRLVKTISDYESDFFPTMIHLSRVVHQGNATTSPSTGGMGDGNSIVFLDTTMLKKAWLQPVLAEITARIAHSTDGVLSSELTLDYGHPNAHLWVANVTA